MSNLGVFAFVMAIISMALSEQLSVQLSEQLMGGRSEFKTPTPEVREIFDNVSTLVLFLDKIA